VFTYIQMVWGFIAPGIVAAFLFGLAVKRAPPLGASSAMGLGVPIYAILLWTAPQVAFLHHMAITFIIPVAFMAVVTKLRPLREPVVLPDSGKRSTRPRWKADLRGDVRSSPRRSCSTLCSGEPE